MRGLVAVRLVANCYNPLTLLIYFTNTNPRNLTEPRYTGCPSPVVSEWLLN